MRATTLTPALTTRSAIGKWAAIGCASWSVSVRNCKPPPPTQGQKDPNRRPSSEPDPAFPESMCSRMIRQGHRHPLPMAVAIGSASRWRRAGTPSQPPPAEDDAETARTSCPTAVGQRLGLALREQRRGQGMGTDLRGGPDEHADSLGEDHPRPASARPPPASAERLARSTTGERNRDGAVAVRDHRGRADLVLHRRQDQDGMDH